MKHINTARTSLGFIQSIVARCFPRLSKSEKLGDIYNYLPIENLYATSGQPSEAQFLLIKDAGYEVVINLAPSSRLENAVIEEERILGELGLKYVHIPVNFKNSTKDDFQAFIDNVDGEKKTWVHCAANMRVSAFTYRYRTDVLGEEPSSAALDLHKIWEPVGVWSKFIQK